MLLFALFHHWKKRAVRVGVDHRRVNVIFSAGGRAVAKPVGNAFDGIHTIELTDRRLAKIVRQCQELPGYDLFEYIDRNVPRKKKS